jgi:amidase
MTVESDIDVAFASASSLARLLGSRQLSATELIEFAFERIERLNGSINAIVTLDADRATARARAADEATARGESWGPLHGVPYTLKDTQSTQGVRTTAGYPPLRDYVPEVDATVAARLKAAGGILLGKTNSALLAYDQQTTNPIFGRTNNPWDQSRTPSGSSGGAGAAIAAGLTPLDVGSDSGGSIRVPAHFCGIYGLKPTMGLVSEYGHIPELPGRPRLDWVLSTSGPLARSLEDIDLALRLIAGPDGKDRIVAPRTLDAPAIAERGRLRIAWTRTFPGTTVSQEIAWTLERLATDLAKSGVCVEEVIPVLSFEEQWHMYQTISNTTWRNRARLYGIHEVDDGEVLPSRTQVSDALDRRQRVVTQWEAFFAEWDVLLCPPCMTTAYPHCEPGSPILVDGKPARYDEECRHGYEFNLTGHPSLVCPLALSSSGLPIGVQMVSARWADVRLLDIASAISDCFSPLGAPPGFS